MPSTSIESAATDGRARAPRYIQRQLANLHKAITTNAKQIQDVIVVDTNVRSQEAQLEIYLAVSTVKDLYDSFSVEEALSKEYQVARGEDWRDRNDAVGVVYLRPQSHTLLYSIVSPLANAIAAGNCVVIESSNTHKTLSPKIEETFMQYLDQDTIAFVEKLPDGPNLTRRALVVDQTGNAPARDISSIQAPKASARAVALVDRSADIKSAARWIVKARIAFGGRSPYAPDLILVNEFVVKEFIEAAIIALSEHIDDARDLDTGDTEPVHPKDKDGTIEKELRDPGVEVVMQGNLGKITMVNNRESAILQRRVLDANLIVHPIRSLDDAIDLANLQNETLLAGYHFGAPEAAKYTTQFIDSYVSFVNHIPIELTVGPAAPIGFHPSATHRYRPELFSIPKADYTSEASASRSLVEAMKPKGGAWSRTYQQQITASLAPTGQRAGKVVGFFDQGLITGFAVFWVPLLLGAAAGSAYGVRAGLRMIRS